MSALFDEWAYQEIYAVEHEEPAAPELKKEETPELVEIESPEVRPRSKSTSDFHERAVPGLPKIPLLDVPLTSAEARKEWNLDTWLGLTNPKRLNFDETVWEARMQKYLLRESEIGEALRKGKSISLEAKYLHGEADYLTQDLADVHLTDLSPLESYRLDYESVTTKSEFVNNVNNALHMWSVQDEVARSLRQPPQRIIAELPELMQKINYGLQFCHNHQDFVDIKQTELAWMNSAQRACAVGVAYCTHELRKECTKTSEKIDVGNRSVLLYRKFASDLSRIQPTLAVLYAASLIEGLQPYWTEITNTYTKLRSPLVSSLVSEYVKPLYAFSSLSDEFFESLAQSLLQFRSFYKDELSLFTALFNTEKSDDSNDDSSSKTIALWLQDLSDPLYSSVRKLVVRENQIEPLCRLLFTVNEEESDNSAVSQLNSFHTIYSDSQQRLVFRADLLIDQLAKYQPKKQDFSKEKYPTVQQTLDLLSQVYQLLKQKLFNDLAQRCVRECVRSLETAAASTVSVHNQVYHIKQLLILQSQVVEFDLEHLVVRDVDFSGIWHLLELSRNRNFREVLALAWSSVPRVVEVMYDAMEETYLAFRRAVERLCQLVVSNCFKKELSYADICLQFRTEFSNLNSSAKELIHDPRVVAVLLDSVRQAVLDEYSAYYHMLSLDQRAEGEVMDDSTMAVWLAEVVNTA